MSVFVTCTHCNTFIHRINKRYCCGVDYYIEEQASPPIEVAPREKVDFQALARLLFEEPTSPIEKKSAYKISDTLRAACFERDAHCCQDCGASGELHPHHIVYRSNGGAETLENLVSLCPLCHMERHKGEPVYNLIKRRFKG